MATIAVGGGALRGQAGWQSIDIGTTTAGATSESGGVIAISGSGRDIWNTADGFRYYYREVSGEFDFRVRVRSLQHTWDWAKAGIMARQSINPGSPHDMICVTPAHGTAFQWRETVNGSSSTTTPTEDGGAPRWLRLTRTVGGGFSEPYRIMAYTSTDGINWILAASYYRAYSGPLLVGLAVTSHMDGVLCRAEFEQFSPGLPPVVASNLRVTHRGPNGQLDLAWTDNSTDETGFVIEARRERLRDYVKIGEVGVNVTAFSARDSYLSPSWGYSIRVKALKGAAGAYSDPMQAQATPNVDLSLLGQTANSVSLRIVETTPTFGTSDGWYAIERSTDNVNFVQVARDLRATSATVSSKTCDYTDPTVAPNTTYYYRARYLDPNGDSGAYDALPGPVTTSDAASSPPAAPSNLRAVVESATSIHIFWDPNSSAATGFEVERATSGGAFARIATLPAVEGSVAGSYQDSGLSPSTAYQYRVRAVRDGTARCPLRSTWVWRSRATSMARCAPRPSTMCA